MAQFGLPTSDITKGANTAQGLSSGDGDGDAFDELDESIASVDTTTLWKQVGTTEAASLIECGLNSVTDPVSSASHVLRVHVAKGNSNGTNVGVTTGGQQIDVTYRLKQSTTTIATGTSTNFDSGFTTLSTTLSGAEADAITNYAALRISCAGVRVGGGSGRGLIVSAYEFECPDAPSGDLTPQDIDAVAVGVAVLSRRLLIKRTLAPVAVGVPTVAKTTSRFRTLTSTAVGVPTVAKRTSRFRAFAATAVGVASMSKKMSVTLSSTATGIAELVSALSFSVLLEAVSTGIATLTSTKIFGSVLEAVAVGVASMQKLVSKRLTAASTGVVTMQRLTRKTISAVAVGVVTMADALVFNSTLAAIATGVVTLATQLMVAVAATPRRVIIYFRDRKKFFTRSN
jgi:hypothetical protein